MKYLLDTCVLVDHLRGRQKIESKWVEKGIAISVITWAELMYGAEKSNNKSVNRQLIKRMVDELFIEVLPIDQSISEMFGELKYRQEKIGYKEEDFDLMIAATAMTNELTLITYNIKHFNRIEELKLL